MQKERDLELAARIGQTLLEKNKELSDKADHLEDQLSAANDKVNHFFSFFPPFEINFHLCFKLLYLITSVCDNVGSIP